MLILCPSKKRERQICSLYIRAVVIRSRIPLFLLENTMLSGMNCSCIYRDNLFDKFLERHNYINKASISVIYYTEFLHKSFGNELQYSLDVYPKNYKIRISKNFQKFTFPNFFFQEIFFYFVVQNHF